MYLKCNDRIWSAQSLTFHLWKVFFQYRNGSQHIYSEVLVTLGKHCSFNLVLQFLIFSPPPFSTSDVLVPFPYTSGPPSSQCYSFLCLLPLNQSIYPPHYVFQAASWALTHMKLSRRVGLTTQSPTRLHFSCRWCPYLYLQRLFFKTHSLASESGGWAG